jgi:hypothetical protein
MDYNGKMIAEMKVQDPWKSGDYEAPYVELTLIRMRESGSVIQAWAA